MRPGDADVAGGADDASTGAELAVKILVRDLRRIGGTKDAAGNPLALDADTGALVALYARTLSAIDQARARRGGGREGLADKTLEELMAEALSDPTLRDAAARALGK